MPPGGIIAVMRLARTGLEHLPSYLVALRQGWSPDDGRQSAGDEKRQRIECDLEGFLAGMEAPRRRTTTDSARRNDGSATAWIPPLDVGWGVLCQHRRSLAAMDYGVTALVPGPYRLRGRAVETEPRVCH